MGQHPIRRAFEMPAVGMAALSVGDEAVEYGITSMIKTNKARGSAGREQSHRASCRLTGSFFLMSSLQLSLTQLSHRLSAMVKSDSCRPLRE